MTRTDHVTDHLHDSADHGVEIPARGDREPAFAELGRMLLSAQPLSEVLARVASLAGAALPHAVDVSVTLLEDPPDERPGHVAPAPGHRPPRTPRARSVAFRGGLAVDLDERQYAAGFGPCMDAAVSGATVLVDTADDATYPDFSAAARRHGVGHTASMGLPVTGRTIGALNFYAGQEPFSPAELELATAFAGYAAVALANASLVASTAELARNLQVAMTSRAVIEQAKGILMAREHCTSDEAFELLRKASQARNVKLRDICQAIVQGVADED